MDNNRRSGPRHRAQKTGIIKFHRDHGLRGNGTNCRVHNLSPTGARLEVASQIGIPDEFMLWIEFDQTEVPCQVIWRTATRLGVAFDMTSQLASVLSQTIGPLGKNELSETAKPHWKLWA